MRFISNLLLWLIIIFIAIIFISQPIERHVTETIEEGKVISTEAHYEWHPEKIPASMRKLINKLKTIIE